MALNYTRIGWEDAPSRNTPVDAANLNHMDNGILALSTAYDEDVPRLQEQVDELASNVATNTIKEVLGNFAEVEDAPTATKNYAIGGHLVLNNHLYKASAAITSGDTLVEGTNIERTNVGTEVSIIAQRSARVLKGSLSKSVAYHTSASVGTITLPEGRWFVVTRMNLGNAGNSVYNHTLNGVVVRSPETNGGGSINCVCVDGPVTIDVTTYHNITNGTTVNVGYYAIEIL